MTESALNQDHRTLLRDALLKIRELKARVNGLQRRASEPIAIIGMGCRLPPALHSADDFWHFLSAGEHSAAEVPADRWNVDEYFDANTQAAGKICSRYGCFLDDIACFDADFFGISLPEARSIDPQHRLLLEVSWEAIEHAGQSTDRLYNGQTGVFFGISGNDYSQLLSLRSDVEVDAFFGTGISHSMAAGRISHWLGLRGPSLAIDTACSSSLVATHLACQSLRSGECDLALAGGVNVILLPKTSIYFTKAGLLSVDGRCRAFDAAADGVVRSEGCGVVALKRLSDAEADRDNVLAVVRGSAVNHDGPSGGLTVPNGPAQQALIRKAMEVGGLDPLDVGFVEAHGAGTPLGDAIEIGALAATYGRGRPADQPLLVASHKTNLGHLEAAGGIAGLIKVVLSLRHGEIPPHLFFNRPNPNIPWQDLPIQVPTRRTSWPGAVSSRIAGVSSFSFSGTNAHLIVEQTPQHQSSLQDGQSVDSSESPYFILTVSAQCEAALRESARRYSKHLRNPVNFADICFTANCRAHLEHRVAVIAESASQAAEKLRSYAAGRDAIGLFHGVAKNDELSLLPGLGGRRGAAPDRDLEATDEQMRVSDFANLESLAKQYVQGGSIDWNVVDSPSVRRKVPLPTYPFQRQRCWFEGGDTDNGS